MTKTIAILNQKGGTSKTILAINISRCLQKQGAKVLGVDTDLQHSWIDWHESNNGDQMPVLWITSHNTLEKDIKHLSGDYDYVVIDSRGTIDPSDGLAGAIFMLADVVLIPLQPYAIDINSTSGLLPYIEKANRNRQTPLIPLFVATMCKPNTKTDREIAQAFDEVPYSLLDSRTYHRQIYPVSYGDGSTVLDEDPRGKAAGEIRNLTNEILENLK